MSRDQHLSEAVELINAATLGWTEEDVVGKGGGGHTGGDNSSLRLLHQVQELCLNRDASILSDIIPLMLPLQSNLAAPIRKFALTFLRDVVKLYPQYAPTLARAIVYLLNDDSESVRRQCILAAVSTFHGALRWLVHGGGMSENWQDITNMKNSVLRAVNDPAETVSSIAIKFVETVVLSYVPGEGVGLNAARVEDRSIHRELPYTHPFLRAVRLEQEGYALSNEMTQWLKLGKTGDGSIRFGPKHYNVLINALQNTATMKSSLYSSIIQAMIDVLERAESPDSPRAPLHTIMSQLCSACLKLLRVAPSSPLPVIQRLIDVVASIAGSNKTRQAVEANVNIRGLIRVPQATVTPATKAATPIKNITDLICSKMGSFPPPPPRHSQHRLRAGWGGVGKGQAAFAFLVDRIAMEGIGTRLATTEEQLSMSQIALGATRKRGRSSFTVTGEGEGEEEDDGDELEDGGVLERQEGGEGGYSADVTGTPPDTQEIKWFETSTEAGDVGSRAQAVAEAVAEAEGPNRIEMDVSEPVDIPMDPSVARLSQAYKAFTRILATQENVQAEGASLLRVKLLSKLVHLLAEAEATFEEEPKTEMGEENGDGIAAQKRTWQTRTARRLTSYLLEDYVRRYSLACSVLSELYVAEFPKKGIVVESQGLLYEGLLLAILSGLTLHSIFQTYKGKKFFAATVMDAPRLPEACIYLVCGMCDDAEKTDKVFAGIMTLRDVVLYRPAARHRCLEKLLSLTSHKDRNVRTAAVQAVANQLWIKTELRQRIEECARESLQEVLTFVPVPSGEDGAAAIVENSKYQKPNTEGLLTPEATRWKLSLYFALCIKSEDMFLGLFDAYARAEEAVRSGITLEMQVLMRAMHDPKRYSTSDARGESMAHVISLLSGVPKGTEALLIEVLDLLVPIEENDPHPQLIAAAKKLRVNRYGYNPGGGGERNDDVGLTAIVPVLRGLGQEAARELLPSLLRQTIDDKPLVKRGLKRLTMPRDSGLFSPVEMLVLLHKFDFTATNVPRKCLGEAVSICLDDRSTYKYRVVRETLDKLSTPNDTGQPLELPIIIMRTVLLALRSFPELKKYIASVLLPRLVQCQVWREPTVWQGFILCAAKMGSGTGATSFKALCQLPAPQLRVLLKEEKSLRDPLRAYASNSVINLDPSIKEVLEF